MIMKGPLKLVRSGKIKGLDLIDLVYEWSEGSAYLAIDEVSFGGKRGAILSY
jgi:hypothetical protein